MIGKNVRQRLFVAAVALALAGCAGLEPVKPSGEASTAQRRYHDSASFEGRLSVHYQGPQKEEALHGSFMWDQTPAGITVTLLSPLGQTLAIIQVTPQGANLSRNGQPPHSAADVDALTENELGWPLPVAGLRDWLQGFGVDARGRHFVASPGIPEVITNDGWLIRYASWQEEASNRPRRIDLTRTTQQAGDVSIRIVIDSWQER